MRVRGAWRQRRGHPTPREASGRWPSRGYRRCACRADHHPPLVMRVTLRPASALPDRRPARPAPTMARRRLSSGATCYAARAELRHRACLVVNTSRTLAWPAYRTGWAAGRVGSSRLRRAAVPVDIHALSCASPCAAGGRNLARPHRRIWRRTSIQRPAGIRRFRAWRVVKQLTLADDLLVGPVTEARRSRAVADRWQRRAGGGHGLVGGLTDGSP